MHYHTTIEELSTADGSFVRPVALHVVMVNEQPLPAVAGKVLLAVNATTPRLVPVVPVLLLTVVSGQLLTATADFQVPATDTRPTPAPVLLITTFTVALHVTCMRSSQ